jgi:sucrose-6-phosphate hydrolase SacC (GH32 family)
MEKHQQRAVGRVGIAALAVAAVAIGPAIGSVAAPPLRMSVVQEDLMHFRPSDEALGDVHPYYESGTYYLFSVGNGFVGGHTFAPRLATSTDLLNWTPQTLTHTGSAPAQPYYALGIVKDGSTYRTWYGNGGNMQSSESSNLTSWSNASGYAITNNTTLYPGGARDPYVFWDPDVSKWRMVSTAYRTTSPELDVSIALTTSTGSSANSWGTQGDLIRYQNVGVSLGQAIDPEVAHMLKMGDRWYLFTSLARQSPHGVGRTTYYIGDAGETIDQVDWQSKPPQYIDGEDIAAGQVFQAGGRTLFLGWIPQSWNSDVWGGNLSLPRQVYQLTDGTLAVKLPNDVELAMRGDRVFPDGVNDITAQSGTWVIDGPDAAYTGNDYGYAVVPGDTTNLDLEFSISMGDDSEWAGLELAQPQANPYGIEITLDKENSLIRIRRHDGTDWYNYSTTPVPRTELMGVNHVRVVTEGDIIEFFVNGKYSISARVQFDLTDGNIRLFSHGSSSFSGVGVFDLDY